MTKLVLVARIVVLGGLILYETALGEMNLAKVLVGTWQGEVHFFGMNPNRTLVIASVLETDGKWVARGEYGITGKPLHPVQIDIDWSGPKPVLRFTTSANSRVRLNLFDEKNLLGTMALMGAGRAGSDNLAMKLEKLQ